MRVLIKAFLFSLISLSAPIFAQEAEELFAQRCASCHLNPDPVVNAHTPSRENMASFTPESVYAALNDGLMRLQATGLDDIERRSLAAWITGRAVSDIALEMSTNMCAANPSLINPDLSSHWNGWGQDERNTRFAEDGGLSAADLPKLKLQWAFGLPGEGQPRAQPAIMGGRLYVGNRAGALYALDAKSGCTYWSFLPRSGIRSALSVAPITLEDGSESYAVYFIDILANAYAVNAHTGELIWQRLIDEHPSVRGTGSVTVHEGRVYVPITGVTEENTASNPDYSCCTFRGSVSSLDANTGELIWKHFTVPEPKARGMSANGKPLYGPAGVGIWSAPTVDASRGLLYVATGNAYADPAPVTSDAVIAIDIASGEQVWVKQLLANDAWIGGCNPDSVNANCPETVGPDFDFSASPILATNSLGKSVIVVPQKSGLVYGLDPDKNGELLWEYRVGPGSPVGGVWGASVANDAAYIGVGGYFSEVTGGMHGININTGERLWYTPPQELLCAPGQGCGPTQSAAVTSIPGAVFSGSQDGGMRAYDAENGEVIWTFDANQSFATVNGIEAVGASFDGAGPVVADGMLYMLSGNAGFVGRTGNVLLVFAKE